MTAHEIRLRHARYLRFSSLHRERGQRALAAATLAICARIRREYGEALAYERDYRARRAA